ncbi:hypothetical protein [Proteiniclasticum ruminis]|uniref:Uncharacterized protein n=1 Tax=Proteiniclasticum ruminis TaxID=398199 RepID=A0A1I5EYU3_9CLOT|nr:hypothetical protein [Proteiniclasticum ruminis]SFO16566.1 hypothetical protein SAMN04488695_12311 [Proteiniclasticum ruminis]
MNWDKFCQIIHLLFHKRDREIKFDNSVIEMNIYDNNIRYTKSEFETLLLEYNKFDYSEFSIYNNDKYEALVHVDKYYNGRLSEDRCIESDEVSIYMSKCSDEIILSLLNEFKDELSNLRFFYSSFRYRETNIELFDLLRGMFRANSLYIIKKGETMKRELFENMALAFSFNYSYNIDRVVRPVNSFSEIVTMIHKRSARMRYDDLSVPLLNYKKEIVDRYLMAQSSEDIFVQFIGYYQIMEHFFSEVSKENIHTTIKEIIQHPGFSPKRKKDTAKLAEAIITKMNSYKEDFRGTEIEALELTLEKYIDIQNLMDSLNDFENGIVNYYSTHEVSFSKGKKVELMDSSNKKIFKDIASRIYNTRNSLVHSKSNEYNIKEKGIYRPFKDSAELSKELPLMRIIAETIIIKTSSEM